MTVFNDGPTVTGDAGIGAEFETPLVNFQNSQCNPEDTFGAKRSMVSGRTGLNFTLTVDTASTELGAGKLNPEYIIDGRDIKVGDGSAGAAASKDFKTDLNEQVTPPPPASPIIGTEFAGLSCKYNVEGRPDPLNPQTINIKDWIQNIGIGNPNPDILSASYKD